MIPSLSDITSLFHDLFELFDVPVYVLWDWLPSDLVSALNTLISILFFVGLIGLIKKAIVFLG